MKFFLVSPQYLGTITGSSGLYVLELSKELAYRGNDVTVLTLGIQDAQPEETLNLPLLKTYPKRSKYSIKIKRFWTKDSKKIISPYDGNKEEEIKRLKDFNQSVSQYLYSAVRTKSLIHLNGHFMVPSLARELKKSNKCKIITSIHSIESYTEAKKNKGHISPNLINFIKIKEQDALLNSDYIFLWSEALKEEIAWIYPQIFKKINIKVIPFGIPSSFLEKVQINQKIQNLLMYKYKLNHDFIFNLNRIDPSKGIEYLIMAFPIFIKKLRKHYNDKSINYNLFIAGLLETKNNWYYKKLIRQIKNIKEKDIRNNIIISTDSSIIEDKNILYKMSRIFAMPSIVSPFGMSLIEAITKGSPFVASGIEGILNILGLNKVESPFSRVSGGTVVHFLNPISRVNHLAEALFYIHTNYEKVKSSLKTIQKKLINKYSWKKNIDQHINIYNKLMR